MTDPIITSPEVTLKNKQDASTRMLVELSGGKRGYDQE